MEQVHDEKRTAPKRRSRAREEWASNHLDKPHRDALEHARPPVKDPHNDYFRDRETAVPARESQHAR